MHDLPRGLFWDVDPESLDQRQHQRFIIERILMLGRPADIRWLLAKYAESEIRNVVCCSRQLDCRTANYWAVHFGIPREEIACFQKQSPYPFIR